MKRLLPVIFGTALSQFAFAQEREPLRPVSAFVYGGIGQILPSSSMQKKSMIDKGVDFSFGYYQSLTAPKKLGKSGTYRIGFELAFHYSKFDKALKAPDSIANIRYNDGTAVPQKLRLRWETLKKDPDAFHYLAGPSVLFSWSRFIFQPSLLAGYASVSQERFRFYDVITNYSGPTQQSEVNFYTAGHQTNNGFALMPKIKAGYRFQQNLALLLAASYSIGGKQKFDDLVLKPADGPVSDQGVYSYNQITTGTLVPGVRQSKLSALLIDLTLALTFNKTQ